MNEAEGKQVVAALIQQLDKSIAGCQAEGLTAIAIGMNEWTCGLISWSQRPSTPTYHEAAAQDYKIESLCNLPVEIYEDLPDWDVDIIVEAVDGSSNPDHS